MPERPLLRASLSTEGVAPMETNALLSLVGATLVVVRAGGGRLTRDGTGQARPLRGWDIRRRHGPLNPADTPAASPEQDSAP